MRKTALISILLVAMLFSASLTASAGLVSPENSNSRDNSGEILCYTVKPGDTLYSIGKRYGINFNELKKINGISSNLIIPGAIINIPAHGNAVHVVKPGDTLCEISRLYGAEIKAIRFANELVTSTIKPGMRLFIPVGKDLLKNKLNPDQETSANIETAGQVLSHGLTLTKDDIYLLAKLIHAEARGESLEGQIAVGAVIINRLLSGEFPQTVREIIFQSRRGVYQFTPVQDGQINLEPDKQAFTAAKRAISGEDPTEGALFFYNPELSSDQWIRTLTVKKVIGNHVFAK